MQTSKFRTLSQSINAAQNIRVSGLVAATNSSQGVACSLEYFASVHGNGTSVILVPVDSSIAFKRDNPFVIHAHGGEVTDIAFSPHSDFLLATVGKDDTVKVWDLPSGGLTAHISTPRTAVSGLSAPCSLAWHPTVADLVAVGCKDGLAVVNMASSNASILAYFKVGGGVGRDVTNVAWNRDGSKIAALIKDGNVAVVDPRPYLQQAASSSSTSAAAPSLDAYATSLGEMKSPGGVTFIGSAAAATEQVLVAGLGKMRKPMYRIFDANTAAAAAGATATATAAAAPGSFVMTETSTGNLPFSSGQLLLAHDPDAALVFIGVRSSQTISVYDVSATATAGAAVGANGKINQTFVSGTTLTVGGNTRGFALLPKRGVDVLSCEIDRLLVNTGDTIVTVSAKAMRKVVQFHQDLFPDTAGLTPSSDFNSWLGGNNSAPNLVSLDPAASASGNGGGRVTASGSVATAAPSPSPSSSPSPSPSSSSSSSSSLSPSPTNAATAAPAAECKTVTPPPATTTTTVTAPAPAPVTRPSATSISSTSTGTGLPSGGYHARVASGSLGGFDANKAQAVISALSRTPFLHTAGQEPIESNKAKQLYQLKVGQMLPLNRTVVTNGRFVALPWGSGASNNSVYVRHATSTGRASEKPCLVSIVTEGIAAMAMSDIQTRLLAVAGGDGVVRVVELPDTDTWKDTEDLPRDYSQGDAKFAFATGGRVQRMGFHPYVRGLLVVAVFSPDFGDVIKMYNVDDDVDKETASFASSSSSSSSSSNPESDTKQAPREFPLPLGLFNDRVLDFDFSPNNNMMAVTTRDCNVTLLAIPSGRPLGSFTPVQKYREAHIRFLDENHLVTVGFAKGNERSVSLYNIATGNMNEPKLLKTQALPNVSALVPHLDIASGILIVANIGSAFSQILHITPAEPHIDLLSTWTSRNELVGIGYAPKAVVNAKDVEIVRAYKLGRDNHLWPISFTVPRKRKEFFQDDLYPKGAPSITNVVTSKDFFTGVVEKAGGRSIVYESLQPADMTPLSSAPEEQLNDRQQAYVARKLEAQAAKPVSFMGHRSAEESMQYLRERAARVGTNSGRWSAQTKEDNKGDDAEDSDW